jgi:hypothetical protein
MQVNAVIKELRCDKPMSTAACSATYMDLRNDVRHLVHWQVALARKHYEYDPPPYRSLSSRSKSLTRYLPDTKSCAPSVPT